MKRTSPRRPSSPELPIAWRESEYAALLANPGDPFDDRVGEDIFDVEDERAEIEFIVHGITRGLH